jgi:hypothetical protein
MLADNDSHAVAEAEWLATETFNSITVAYDDENNAITFRERDTDHIVHTWAVERPDVKAVTDLFVVLTGKTWATKETLQATARIVNAIIDRRLTPGRLTLQEELAAILRANGNRWMTTAELAAEVNRRGRHWKTHRNRMTAAQVHGRTKLYTSEFEQLQERVRLVEG